MSEGERESNAERIKRLFEEQAKDRESWDAVERLRARHAGRFDGSDIHDVSKGAQ